MPDIPPIKPVIAFEAAARLGSFKKAAEELAITPSAISHNIAILEKYLGVRLFNRQTRSLALTSDGYKYSVLIGQITGNLESATREMTQQREHHTLTIESLPTFAGTWLSPRIRQFSEMNPDIDVRLRTSFAPVDPIGEDTEIAFTYVESAPRGYLEIAIINEKIGPLAEPGYWAGLSGRNDYEKFANATLLHSDRNLLGWKNWLDRSEMAHPRLERGPRFDRGQIALDIAASGWGITLESSTFADIYLQRGLLIELFPDKGVRLFARTHKMLIPESLKSADKVQRFANFIIREGNISGDEYWVEA